MKYDVKIAALLAKLLDHPDISPLVIEQNLNPAKKGVDADFAINCFSFRKYLNKDGMKVAQELSAHFTEDFLHENEYIDHVEAVGPYLNFKINKTFMAFDVITQIFQDIQEFSTSAQNSDSNPQKIVIEYPAPNTNKPLHFGHVRNMLLGQSLAKLNQKIGNMVYEVNLLNDRGIHICKSMWAYQQYGDNKTPESERIKSDHFVGQYYVKYAEIEEKLKQGLEDVISKIEEEKKKPPKDRNRQVLDELQQKLNQTEYGKLQETIKNMLLRWEQNDPDVLALWKKMNAWAKRGFDQTFQTFGITHDKVYYESNIYDKGKDIVKDGVAKGIFKELDDGAVVAQFNKKGFPKNKILLRSDGTTLYITQDLYLAFQKMTDFQYDTSIYVVGNEQNMQLRMVFEILEMLGMEAQNLHYSYGMINLTTGKMKSREGTVVDADEIVEELTHLGFREVNRRYKNISTQEIENRAKIIGMAALRFFILKYDYKRDFLFDPEESIAFEGETGPYILYSYARICSILKNAIEEGIMVPYNPNTNEINQEFVIQKGDFRALSKSEEEEVIEQLYLYPDYLLEAATQLKPHTLARYLYELAQVFTSFYHECYILNQEAPVQRLRLYLIEGVRRVLKDGLKVLSINVLNEM